jgi:cell division transport system permease protein
MILFWIKESFKLIGRAKSSFFLALMSMSISVILICASLLSIELSHQFKDRFKKNMSINIFLKDNLSSEKIMQADSVLNSFKFINSKKFISKDQAVKNFIKETGEDFRTILDYNPLPASFLITLKPEYVEKNILPGIIKQLSKINGVDEVVYQQEFIYKMLSYVNKIQTYIFVITGVLFLVSLYIVFSTVKIITKSKYEEMETMKLIGAKLSTIKMPIILNSMFIGLFAGLICISIFSGIGYYLGRLVYLQRFLNLRNGLFIITVLLIGPLIGIIVSIFSLRKITLKV